MQNVGDQPLMLQTRLPFLEARLIASPGEDFFPGARPHAALRLSDFSRIAPGEKLLLFKESFVAGKSDPDWAIGLRTELFPTPFGRSSRIELHFEISSEGIFPRDRQPDCGIWTGEIDSNRITVGENGKRTECSPKNKEVAEAMASQDVKSLSRLFIENASSEAHTVLCSSVDGWGKRNEWEYLLMAYLDHEEARIVFNAASELGGMKCKRAVPALIATLESNRSLVKPWATTKGDLTVWGETNARESIISALGKIGDRSAIQVLEKYLSPQPGKRVFPGNVAYALFEITGERYRYRDYDGSEKIYPATKTIK